MSFDDGFMIGLMLSANSEKGGDDVYIVSGEESSLLVMSVSERNSENPSVSQKSFSFTAKKYNKITVMSSGSTTITKTWTKNIITSVSDSSGSVIFTMDVDTSGKITACYDRSGNEILWGSTNGESVLTSTPEGIALGWALAYSREQNELMEEAIKAYEDGRNDEQQVSGGGNDNDDTDFSVKDLEGNGAVATHYLTNGKSQRFYGDYIILESMTADFCSLKKNSSSGSQSIRINHGASDLDYTELMGCIYDKNGEYLEDYICIKNSYK